MTAGTHLFPGGCHCGAVRFRLTLSRPAAATAVRACACRFCRAHAAATVTDPAGLFEIENGAPALQRYRFGLRTADYLLCRNCGVYLAAAIDPDGAARATVNVHALDDPSGFAAPEPVSYDGETAAERLARRRTRWTPTRFVSTVAA